MSKSPFTQFDTALAVGTLRGVHKTDTPTTAVLSTVNRRVILRGVSPRYAAVQYGCYERIGWPVLSPPGAAG